MTKTNLVKLAAALAAVAFLSSCANTIRGAGQDAANTVNATQSAGHKVTHAAKY